jgi:mannose-6-phosphate isomerase-like protein (cupin superfamily)
MSGRRWSFHQRVMTQLDGESQSAVLMPQFEDWLGAFCGRSLRGMNPPGPPATILHRDVSAVAPWAETCGQIRPLLEDKDGAAAEVHHLQITDAKLHYHQRTDEIYYVLNGRGHMRVGDEEIELHKDRVVYVPRGVKHKAWGDLTVLVVCIPRGVLQDVHELE